MYAGSVKILHAVQMKKQICYDDAIRILFLIQFHDLPTKVEHGGSVRDPQ